MPQAATTSTSFQENGVPSNPAWMPSAKCLTGKIRAVQMIQAGCVVADRDEHPVQEQQRQDRCVDDRGGEHRSWG
jgi:hypothetical protein